MLAGSAGLLRSHNSALYYLAQHAPHLAMSDKDADLAQVGRDDATIAEQGAREGAGRARPGASPG